MTQSGIEVSAPSIAFESPDSNAFEIATNDLSTVGVYTIEVTAAHADGTGNPPDIVQSFNLNVNNFLF